MELRQENYDGALRLMKRATTLPGKRLVLRGVVVEANLRKVFYPTLNILLLTTEF